ncbi:MAG: carboxypeptidase regulatory-like domain-containing protein [Acidobacteriaceae bacterium]|nr:carboxypeptidase regulatory-like domain-containing protein [Acidobacteriaceae bacterium]MBV9778859.1 carboxypeptidase regulatory-like domain-containing protein [Acidobacteriaceae bacterium]
MQNRRTITRFALVLTCALVVCLIGIAPSWAQQVTASITGEVTDPSGAAVAGAKITATDTQRGTQYTGETNSNGRYTISNLPVGTYDVKVENPGFQTATVSNVTLELNQVAKLDFPMQIGNVATTVEVTSAAPALQTESTQLGQVIDARTNTTLPLATRNYVQLTLLTAGSVHPDPSSFTNGQTTASSGRPYVNGNREQANNFILDGMDNNQVSDNLVGYAPSVDAIQEFNEITQNAPAEFGNFMGGIISTQIKSGANAYHGDLFEFFRNDVLNANSWSNNFTNSPKPKLRWNEFGGTFGGRIIRDKLFFFVDYQGQRFDTPTSIGPTSVLTAAERNGNFSQLLQGPHPIQLFNPYVLDKNGNRVPFAGDIIPKALLDPVALKIVNSSAYPLPTLPGLINNYLYATHTAINGDQGDARVDWNLSEQNRIFGRYSQSIIDNPSTNNMPLFYNGFATYPTHNGVLDWVHTFSPTVINEARVGVNYVFINNGASANGVSDFPAAVGLPGIPSTILPSMVIAGNSGNAANIGNSDIFQLFADTVIQYEDTMNISKGVHTLHLGFQGWRQRIDTFYSGNNGRAGTFNFDGRYTAGPNPLATQGTCLTPVKPCPETAGIADADFMLGLPASIGGGVNGGTWGQRANIFAAFFQDDWHVTPTLTLNLGLRWELHTPWVEVHDRQTNFGLISGAIELAGQNGNSRALYNQYNGITNYQPRIGIAWNPRKNTVVRSAYTLSSYLEGTGTNLRLPINPPFAHETDASYTSLPFPGSVLSKGFLPLEANTGNPFAGALLRVWDPNVRPAVSNQWNFTVQQELNQSTTLQVGYVGQKTTHLAVPMPYFQRALLPNGSTVGSPYLSGNPTLYNEISQISGTATNGNQSYNALQAVLQKRISNGLEGSVAYTYSKCMTDSSGYYGSWGGQTTPTSPYWQNLYDKKAEWGPCYYDAEHVLTSYATYDIPIGRGRAIGHDMNKVVNAVIGDWQVNGILQLHTGFPLTISAGDASGTNSRGSRANCIAPVHIFGEQNSPSGGYQWFDQNAFAAAAPHTFGTCGVGTVRGPGLHTLDLSLAKFFDITERQKIEFRAESINLTNTPILNSPNTGLGSNLGLLQSSQGARNLQFALKYLF